MEVMPPWGDREVVKIVPGKREKTRIYCWSDVTADVYDCLFIAVRGPSWIRVRSRCALGGPPGFPRQRPQPPPAPGFRPYSLIKRGMYCTYKCIRSFILACFCTKGTKGTYETYFRTRESIYLVEYCIQRSTAYVRSMYSTLYEASELYGVL